jgi:hypothetical protein
MSNKTVQIKNRWTGAVIREAPATIGGRAALRGAALSGAVLRDADLRDADLRDTCLDPVLPRLARAFVRVCAANRRGGRIVYRTAWSQHVGATEYSPGRTYIAPNLSFSVETECHPGIYAGSLDWMHKNYRNVPLVRCYVRDGDWTITAKGCIRCARLRVLGAA